MTTLTQKLNANLETARCAAPEIENLTEQQLAALHVFRHEVLASLNRLYMRVPKKFADPIVDKYLSLKPEATPRTLQLTSNLQRARCAAPEITNLTEEQLAALHAFRHEVLAALSRLHMNVPKAFADPIVDRYLDLTA